MEKPTGTRADYQPQRATFPSPASVSKDRRPSPTGQVMVSAAGITAFLIDLTLDDHRTVACYQTAGDGAGLAHWVAKRLRH